MRDHQQGRGVSPGRHFKRLVPSLGAVLAMQAMLALGSANSTWLVCILSATISAFMVIERLRLIDSQDREAGARDRAKNATIVVRREAPRGVCPTLTDRLRAAERHRLADGPELFGDLRDRGPEVRPQPTVPRLRLVQEVPR